MKWGLYGVLILCVAFSWFKFSAAQTQIEVERAKLTEMKNSGEDVLEPDDIVKQESLVDSKEGEKTFSGILLAFMTAGLVGIVFVIHVLPAIAHRFTHAVYDSAEEVEKDPMHDGRAKVAQGDWEGAIAAFRLAAEAQPLNRLPWVEIAKIQVDQLEDAPAAVQTLRTAIEGQEWEENDAAFLMFRVAEIYEKEIGDHANAATIMQQVIDQFPDTRHSANARHKLREWGVA
ncbi:tol-pal system YbgF family protein [Luteolibacter sp. Populi]|uniref:tetratricopeptide repeat protein n=1 Tax=Luteolibacter sp. Populi TaxID=3230487 RepID=UPI0034672C69